MLLLALSHIVQPQQAATNAAAIELRANVKADRLTIERQGEAHLTVHADPEGGSKVVAEAPRANGRKTLKNIDISLDARAVLATPTDSAPAAQNQDR